MKDRKIIRLSKLPEYDVITELIEYMIDYIRDNKDENG